MRWSHAAGGGIPRLSRMSVDDRRAALVQSAYRVIADHGVEGATTRRICAHAGMPLASFHYAFESRTALLSSVMQTAVPEDLNQMLETLVPDGDCPEADGAEPADSRVLLQRMLTEQLDVFYSMVKSDPGRMQATISLGIYAHNHPELRRVGKAMYEQLYAVAATGLRIAGELTGVRWRTPVENIAPVMIAAATSVTLIYLSTADDAVIDQVLTTLVQQILSFVDN
ncbi:hypothetical protein GCM10009624_17920 [Gordonia sinesedis]